MEGLNLAGGVAALGAGEHVQVDVLEPCVPGLLDAGGALGVHMPEALVAADDGKLVATVAEALPAGERVVVGNVHTKGGTGRDGCENQDEQNRENSGFHLIY